MEPKLISHEPLIANRDDAAYRVNDDVLKHPDRVTVFVETYGEMFRLIISTDLNPEEDGKEIARIALKMWLDSTSVYTEPGDDDKDTWTITSFSQDMGTGIWTATAGPYRGVEATLIGIS